jgi:hypothetical protein
MTRTPDRLELLQAANPVPATQRADWGPIAEQLRSGADRPEKQSVPHAVDDGGARQRRRIPITVIGIGATAAAALVVIAIATGKGTPAYAVSEASDGSVIITIEELVGVSGANAELSKLGIRATVVPVEAGCSSRVTRVPIPPGLGVRMARPSGNGMSIQPSEIPTGDSLMLSAQSVGPGVGLTVGLYRGAAPSCSAPGDTTSP